MANRYSGREAFLNRKFQKYKKHAKIKDVDFLLTINEFFLMADSNCHYCNSVPYHSNIHCGKIYLYTGVDRKDNDIGYLIDNCVPCCGVCNRMKGSMNYTDFITQSIKISNTLKNG